MKELSITARPYQYQFGEKELFMFAYRSNFVLWTLLLCLSLGLSALAQPASGVSDTEESAEESLDGIWTGSWGGGGDGRVVIQPVLAEMYVKGNRVEVGGFPDAQRLGGKLTVDPENKTLVIKPTTDEGERPNFEPRRFEYKLENGKLTLTRKVSMRSS